MSHKKVDKTFSSGWSTLSRDREDTLFVVTGAGVWVAAENTETNVEIPRVSTYHHYTSLACCLSADSVRMGRIVKLM